MNSRSFTQPILAGAFTWWTPKRVRHDVLKTALDSVGIGNHCPPPIARAVALKLALRQYAKANRKQWVEETTRLAPKGTKVRWDIDIQRHASADQNGFEVLLVERTSNSKNHYHSLFSAMVVTDKDTDGKVTAERLEITAHSAYVSTWDIENAFNHHRQMVSGSNVGRFLVKAVKDFNGTTLVEMGGVYFIPADDVSADPSSLRKWDKLCTVMETAGAAEMTRQEVPKLTPSTARTAIKAIAKEITRCVERIKEDITTKELGKKALSNRIEAASDMLGKAQQYADITDGTIKEMQDLRTLIGELQERSDQAGQAAVAQEAAEEVFGDVFAM